MSQALFTSMTGLNVAQQAISVVSNNVANINTTAFKSADARFATLFSNTLSAGNAPSATAGGTNPKQIGLGVKLEGITRNFETGSFLSTGVTSDSMISGKGYYTVMSPSGSIYMTRDGAFTLDANGNMVTATGLKVLGASKLKSEEASNIGIHVPQTFTSNVTGDKTLATRQLGDLNNAQFTTGTLKVKVTDGTNVGEIEVKIGEAGSGADIEIDDLTEYDTFMSNVVAKINEKANDLATPIPIGLTHAIGTGDDSGKEIWTVANAGCSLEIQPSSTANVADCLNFFEVANSAGPATSKVISYTVEVNPTTSPTNMTSLQTYSIGADGTIEATYDNGDKLSVYLDDSNTFRYQYVTSTGVYIKGSENNSPITVNPNVCQSESCLVLQMANVTNEAGLVSQADNLWTAGPDSGKIVYTIAGQLGTGSIQTGGLEASNVDLARELSNMIIAQRAINANSRVFGTASSVLETLSQLGR